ncbi:hypothetical protein QR77_38185 [Streptomyces sp. 150FB]|uniref:hypothetical protein n=1 Tax=Streptomyces sp. 150FB TaxID=1576605 RepID=UPI000588FF10|nr:hypothetical protein [Streptomyces sp. 150FB]KIF78066.1 hypothetical protein QR77_38185 [Streptomyces sp. 150FB]
MISDQEHSARAVREHAAARETLVDLLRTAAGELATDAPALEAVRRRVRAQDRAYAADLERHGDRVPYGLGRTT